VNFRLEAGPIEVFDQPGGFVDDLARSGNDDAPVAGIGTELESVT
jgi:hypothetical protein